MRDKPNKVNIRSKHAIEIENLKIKTIKELVSKLKPADCKRPSIKIITLSEASEMPIDIDLNVFPLGWMFRKEVQKYFEDQSDNINFKSILRCLNEISEDVILDDDQLYGDLKDFLYESKITRTKDPFKSDIPLSEIPATSCVFSNTILNAAAIVINITENQIIKLKMHYSFPDVLMKSADEIIMDVTGIPLSTVGMKKKVVCFGSSLDVYATLAKAIAIELN